MEMKIIVRYASAKLFGTVDLQFMFQIIFERFGEGARIQIERMSEEELEKASSRAGHIRVIRDRFILMGERGERYLEIEDEIINRGQK